MSHAAGSRPGTAAKGPAGPDERLAADVTALLRGYPDFPEPGVLFQDLCPVLAEPGLLARLAAEVAFRYDGAFDVVLAVEARGFPLGGALAQLTASPLVLARKPGKLPGRLHTVRYALEYGDAVLQTQADAFAAGARVLLVDDVLATGGTLAAAARLVELGGGRVAGYAVVATIAPLGGAARLAPLAAFSVLSLPVEDVGDVGDAAGVRARGPR
ncbi:adenine phosphoribosyltransferase [Amycolatopsis sp. H20-H5]|uniref:adenine phosphoribosyltransferase n=1 Tax=Amycolatopsis sp. H20-H5 TaxID=3046309 RepID=UPI002DBE4654|nr:adenine phosphoribosyltransferase [Amycolatopsis sp. H20-H5]MEC3980514.1 adenine phosphoribosyltransferase [Amycolatopsis sp. H20-H5]